jgi:hypothetical protein
LSRIAILVLGALALSLGGVIALESTPGPSTGRGPLAADVTRLGPVAPHAGDTKQVQSWVDMILARPLFSPSRRPPASAAGSGTSGPGFPRLTGIVIMPHRREAIFAVAGRTQPIVMIEGSRLNGVLIKSIDAGAVVIVDAAGTRRLRPSFAPATAASGPAPAASGGANPIMLGLPPVPSGPHASPYASFRGLSGRPLGLVANPASTPQGEAPIMPLPRSPAPAPPGGSP